MLHFAKSNYYYSGFWTDNGAFYYYHPEDHLDYEDTLLMLNRKFDEFGLPVKYVEVDSWWYYKGEDLGVSNWTELPDIFPNGLDAIRRETGWAYAAHNRYWVSLKATKVTIFTENYERVEYNRYGTGRVKEYNLYGSIVNLV